MNNFLSSKTLKQISRAQLLGKYKTASPSYFLIQFIVFIILQFATPQNLNSTTGMILYYMIYFIVTLLNGIFSLGQCHLYLRIIRENTCSLSDTWYGFKVCPDKAIGIQFFLTLIEVLCSIPLMVCYLLLMKNKSAIFAIPFSLSLILFAVLIIFFQMIFSQSFYLLHDHLEWNVNMIIKESARLMKGHKLRLFYISVSFLGIQLLGILTMGIGMLWINPYMYMVRTNFYENLTGELKTNITSIDVVV